MLQQVYAQGVNLTPVDPLNRFRSVADIFGFVLNVIIGVAVGLALVFLGLGGIKYITSAGDAKAAEEARGMLTNAIIGLVIALGAVALRIILFNVIGVGDINIGEPFDPLLEM